MHKPIIWQERSRTYFTNKVINGNSSATTLSMTDEEKENVIEKQMGFIWEDDKIHRQN